MLPPKEQAGLPLRHLCLDLSNLYPGPTLTTWMWDSSARPGEPLTLRWGNLPLWSGHQPTKDSRVAQGWCQSTSSLWLTVHGLEMGGDQWVTLYLLDVAPITLLIILWPPGLPEQAPHLISIRFHKSQRLMGGTRCSQKNLAEQCKRNRRMSSAPGLADCLTCFCEYFLWECPCLWTLCCSEVFPRLCRLMLEAAMEATWILGTQDLVTNARAPETPLVSTISTQTTSKE